MPRQYKRKTTNRLVPHHQVLEAIRLVIVDGKSIRSTSKEKGISKSVLARYIEKYKTDPNCRLTPNYTHSQVFTAEQEESLEEYLLTSSKLFHGLTPQKTRQLAFQIALICGLKIPDTWESNHIAGEVWLSGFLARHPNLAIRSPEANSLARAAVFNKPKIAPFFDILDGIVTKHNIIGRNTLNLDESGISRIQKIPKAISQKGSKQFAQVTSAERGELVTVCGVISSSGQSFAPAFIMLSGATEGSLDVGNESGWMPADIFLQVLEHVVKHAQASKENQVILIMDNLESHISFDALTFAKAQGVHIITLPTQTSHETEPLDLSISSQMKTNYNVSDNSWILRNPGGSITIYQMTELVREAWTTAASPSNIISGFNATRIWPLNPNVFSEGAFVPLLVTDLPAPVQPTHTVQVTIPDPYPSPLTSESPPPAVVLPQPHKLIPSLVADLPTQVQPANIVPVEISKPSPSPSTAGSQPTTGVLPETHKLIPSSVTHSHTQVQSALPVTFSHNSTLTSTYQPPTGILFQEHTGQPEACLLTESGHLHQTVMCDQTPELLEDVFITQKKHLGYPKVSTSILYDLVL